MEKILKMTDVNKIKDKEQRKALNKWAKAGFCGSVIAGTGFGKSRIAVLAIEHALKQCQKARPNKYRKKYKYSGRALLLVPTVQLQDQFREEFSKWNLANCLDNVDILCYQSAYKLFGNYYDIVVCDEIHLGLSSEYCKFFKNNMYDSLLCMTATMPEEEEYKNLLMKIAPVVYKITLDQCVSLGIVAPYLIKCIPIDLTTIEQDTYKKVNNSFVKWKYALGGFDAFDTARTIMGNPNAHPQDKKAAALFYKAIRDRKAIVDFATNKITKFQKLVLKHSDKKILAFSGANKFTDDLCESVDPYALSYHSGKTKKQKETALQKFRDNEIKVLCSTKALNQGLDIPDANMGIICGLTSKSLSMIQRVGRLLRFQEDKIGEIIILYVKNSQEEKWLKQSVKGLNNVIWE